MDKEIKGLEERLQKVNLIVSKLDPVIKEAAFELFKPFILGESLKDFSHNPNLIPEKKVVDVPVSSGDVRDFYASFNPKKPADSALVLAGWIYTQQGSTPFSLEELRSLFDEVGVSCPARIDMTLRNCTRSGKALFQNSGGHGNYRPTVYGENHFKTQMNIRPGKKSN